jgi:hypothetical protein
MIALVRNLSVAMLLVFIWIGCPARAESGGIAPSLFGLPQSQNLGQGLLLYLSVNANPGTALGLSFQWFQNGSPLAGATNSFLLRTDTTFADSGDYVVTARNSAGSVTSPTGPN